ncbi:MAG: UDP-N-acetylmuramate dehydrogenase [Deltaproteobacteria bacterium]|nr:UDP-N-acetylmuramate dehydrogenase [Deltaproteobacteria bacterium]
MSADEPLRRELRRRMAGEVLFDEPAARHTSIGVGGKIDLLLFPENTGELKAVVSLLRERRVPFLPVGNWTNLIVRDGGYRGALLSLARIRVLRCRDEGEKGFLLSAGAGCPLAELVNRAIREAAAGLEFCAGIPGSVGGAVRMNAGAYGGEIGHVVESIALLDVSGEIRDVARKELSFSYRNLDLPVESIIIGAAFRLRRGEAEKIAGRVREIIGLRREKHPLEYPNAGSIFKNPRECPAGRLIEAAGLKGHRIGDAQVSEKHGNFMVNRGAATATDLCRLIAAVQERVLIESGHALETEVKIIGEEPIRP